MVLKSTPFLFLMSGKSIYKNRNERCDRLATHVFLFSAKNRIYKQNTHRHTHIHRVELKTLYFNFDSPLRKRFLRSISRKRLTIEISALEELMVAVSQLIMRVNKPKVEIQISSSLQLDPRERLDLLL